MSTHVFNTPQHSDSYLISTTEPQLHRSELHLPVISGAENEDALFIQAFVNHLEERRRVVHELQHVGADYQIVFAISGVQVACV